MKRDWRSVHVASAAVAAAAMVATPLNRRGGPMRRTLSTIVVTSLACSTFAGSVRRWGSARTSVAAAGTALSTLLVERVGTRTGRPFGRYEYTGALRPAIASVPAIVPLAWFSMAVPARETAHAALGVRSTTRSRILVGSALLTAWDLFLDPQMVGEGYWRWARDGRYRGIPLSNFAGWFVTGLAVMALLEAALPPGEPAAGLVAEYGFMNVMETLGFAAFFRDPVVATVGGLATLPATAVAALSISKGVS
jgi:putative membrane protein